MKYGIICAIPQEIDLLLSDIQSKKITSIASRDFYEGELYGKEVVLVMSRIGKVASASTATTLIDRFHADAILFCGVAGGVGSQVNVGDVVVGDKLCQHDFYSGVDHFRIPLINVSYFEADRTLSHALKTAIDSYFEKDYRTEIPQKYLDEFSIVSPKAVIGTIASGDQFIDSAEKNKWLEEHIENIRCVEMEGAAVAQVCYEFSIPFAVIRVISDSANNEGNTDFERFVAETSCHFTRGIVKAFLSQQKS